MKIQFRVIRGEVAYIPARDELTKEKVEELRSLIEILRDNGYTRIVIDLCDIRNIDSAVTVNELAKIVHLKTVEVIAERSLIDKLTYARRDTSQRAAD